MKFTAITILALNLGSIAYAARDEKALGKDLGYPIGKAANSNW